MVQIAGSLGLAAGVPQLAQLDFRIGVLSYVVMRLAYVSQWARVFRAGDARWRRVALRMMVLTSISPIGWVLSLLVAVEWRGEAERQPEQTRRPSKELAFQGRA